MARPIDLAKWHEWEKRLRRFARSRMSVCAWCRREGVSEVQFYAWRRKLAAHGWLDAGQGRILGRRKASTGLNGHHNNSSNAAHALGRGLRAGATNVGARQRRAARATNARTRAETSLRRASQGGRPSKSGGLFVPVEVVGSSTVEVFLPCGVRVRLPASERRTLCTLVRLVATLAPSLASGQPASVTASEEETLECGC